MHHPMVLCTSLLGCLNWVPHLNLPRLLVASPSLPAVTDLEEGTPVDLESQRSLRLPDLEAQVRDWVGPPHNFEVGGWLGIHKQPVSTMILAKSWALGT
jgi:hypothetical protein